jgi:hypothetical protein
MCTIQGFPIRNLNYIITDTLLVALLRTNLAAPNFKFILSCAITMSGGQSTQNALKITNHACFLFINLPVPFFPIFLISSFLSRFLLTQNVVHPPSYPFV